MSRRLTTLSRLLALLCLLALTALASAPTSQAAEAWGELGHFGDKTGELTEPEAAFGINPEDGTAWTVDIALNAKEESVFRIQQFKQEGATWKVNASNEFRAAELPGGETLEVEGVAFDPGLHRAYVLVDQERAVDPNGGEQAASELWAFSTTTSGGKIEPASGANAGLLVESTSETLKGGPVGQSKLSPNDKEKGQTLVKPAGLAVKASTHQILVTGFVNNEVPAVWAISSEGKIQAAWEDEKNFFSKCGCLNSPVVTSTGRILALGEEEHSIYEIPSGLKSNEAPKRAFWAPSFRAECEELREEKEELEKKGKGGEVELCPFVEELTTLDADEAEGGGMASGPEGNIYVHIKLPNLSEGGNQFGGVLVLNPSLEEIGWTGGGSSASSTKACSVNETGEGGAKAFIGAGEEHAFMFEPGLLRSTGQTKILELGPTGSTAGCPKGSATAPTATAGGAPLEAFPISDKVVFSSAVKQANALSVEWEFEPGVTETVKARQQETTLVEHKFAHAGKFTVKETIHSDDLASPLIEASTVVTILGAPTVRNEEAVLEGSSAAMLKAEINPNLQHVTACEFQYGPATEAFTGVAIKKVACPKAPGEGSAFVAEAVKVTGLEAGKEYHFRLLAANAGASTEPAGTTFRTAEVGAPVAVTSAATGLTTASATLNGNVNPEGTSTTCKFEYGPTTSYGSSVPCAAAPGAGSSPVAVSAAVSGLAAATTYHFRVVAENTKGQKSFGLDLSLKTSTAGGGGGGGGGGTTPTPTPTPTPAPISTGKTEVLPNKAVSPTVVISGTSVTVPSSGSFSVKLSCPAGETTCTGTVTLKTLTAVAATSAHTAKKSILTLATASFSIAGGKLKVVSLHLSAKAKKLLAKLHTVRARVTVVAHDPQGGAHTSTALAVLKAAKKKH
jgi:hypothetical protein